jgi:L-serine dehydratase
MNWSVFDIIGPIMIGPSSSHTAGAANLGYCTHRIFGDDIKKVTIKLFGSFAKVCKGHGTDWALLGGLLGFKSYDQRLLQSMKLAKNKGWDVEYIYDEKTAVDHPNTVVFEILFVNGDRANLEGVSIGGGSVNINKINGVKVEGIDGRKPVVIIIGKNHNYIKDLLKVFGVNQRKLGVFIDLDDNYVITVPGDEEDYLKLKKYIPKNVRISYLEGLG